MSFWLYVIFFWYGGGGGGDWYDCVDESIGRCCAV